MKPLQYTTIALFALASVLIGLRSYGQQKKDLNRYYYVSYMGIVDGYTISNHFGIYGYKLALVYDSLLVIARQRDSLNHQRILSIKNYEITGIYEFRTKQDFDKFKQ